MELDELKKAWGQFNDKVDGQEFVDKLQIEEMLAQKRVSSYGKLLRNERLSIYIMAFLLLCMCILINGSALSYAILAICLITLGMSLFRYYKLKQAGCMKYDLERQIAYILQYRSSLYWGVICSYVISIPIIIVFIYFFNILESCIVVGCILLVAILDIFIFKHTSRRIGKVIEINKELKKLKELL